MRILLKLNLIVVSSFILLSCASELRNLSHSKKDVVKYYESGQYEHDLLGIISDVKEEFKNETFAHRDLVIFDVDETTLSNYDYIKSIDFGYETKLWNEYMLLANTEPIKPMLELYNWFKEKNASLIFLTGRHDITYNATKKNLAQVGYTGYDTLICRTAETKKLPAHDYKSIERKKLIEKGYNIIANIGDLKSDHANGYTGKVVKLPNYLYDF